MTPKNGAEARALLEEMCSGCSHERAIEIEKLLRAAGAAHPGGDVGLQEDMLVAGMNTERITKTPGVCGGRACIDGTRIAVWLIREWSDRGSPIPEILQNYPHLKREDVEAPLDYARDNKDEIDADREENESA